MDNNNYQPIYGQPQEIQEPQFSAPDYQAPQFEQPAYQQPSQTNILPPDIQQRINNVFGKALAATIMSQFPVASIIAIFFGNNALKEIVTLMEICKTLNIHLPGKLKAARVLALVGKFVGLGCTILWGVYLAFFAAYFLFAILLVGFGL